MRAIGSPSARRRRRILVTPAPGSTPRCSASSSSAGCMEYSMIVVDTSCPFLVRSEKRLDSSMGLRTWGEVTTVPAPRRREMSPRSTRRWSACRAVGRDTSRRRAMETSSSSRVPGSSAPSRMRVARASAIWL